jgi:hypothetical protein
MRAQAGLPEMESREKPQRKPEGGFAFFSVMQLVMAWTAFREGQIGLKDLRVYFALAEMKSRRCGCSNDEPPEFTPLEVRKLVGGAGGEREAVNKLLAVGLLREVSKSSIEFATDPGELRFEPETLDATLDLIRNNQRPVPVPRRIIRLIAGGARRTLIATILGHLIRCLYYKRGECHPKGCCKASWIAEVFGVCERGVKGQRRHLVELGWLIPQETPQRTLNLHGLWLAINLAWDALAEAKARLYEPVVEQAKPPATAAPVEAPAAPEAAPEPSPPPAANPPKKLSPLPPQPTPPACTPFILNKKPLPRGSNNQKPAHGGTTGVYNSQSKENRPLDKPSLRDVKPEDLRHPARLLDLHAQAVAAGYISSSEANRLNFFAAAHHARIIGSRNPPGLFVRIVRSGLWSFLTQDDDDAARVLLRRALYPEEEAIPVRGQSSYYGEAPRRSPVLSDDARFVRDITNQLRQRGIPESSVWRLVNRERPEWTRERWDQAHAELQGTSRPLAAAAGMSY